MLAFIRIVAAVIWFAVTLPVQMVIFAVGIRSASIAHWVHRGLAIIAGVRIRVSGHRSTAHRPSFYVCNHCSWLDIIIIGSLLRGAFIAKESIRSWPFFGLCAILQQTIFIDRHASRQIREQNRTLARCLRGGRTLILFAEGTTSDGCRVLPFKSTLFESLFSPMIDHGKSDVRVCPISLIYVKSGSRRLSSNTPSPVAWYGDATLLPHIWKVFSLPVMEVRVHFHRPVDPRDFPDRKALARHCHDVIEKRFTRVMTRVMIGPATKDNGQDKSKI